MKEPEETREELETFPGGAMLVFENNWLAKLLLWKGFSTIMLFGFVLSKRTMGDASKRHESVHACQWMELTIVALNLLGLAWAITGAWWLMLFAPVAYYLWYVTEWVVRRCIPRNGDDYHTIYFEQEAYDSEEDVSYLADRDFFAWIKYMWP
jgi:hypothetical protein